MQDSFDPEDEAPSDFSDPIGDDEGFGGLKGANFLVSAVMSLKKQKKELQAENLHLRERIRMLEGQNSAFLNVSADRLLSYSIKYDQEKRESPDHF